jgi:hypothetical protein
MAQTPNAKTRADGGTIAQKISHLPSAKRTCDAAPSANAKPAEIRRFTPQSISISNVTPSSRNKFVKRTAALSEGSQLKSNQVPHSLAN